MKYTEVVGITMRHVYLMLQSYYSRNEVNRIHAKKEGKGTNKFNKTKENREATLVNVI